MVAGTALRLLCLPLAAAALASCQRQQPVQAGVPDGNLQEVHELIAATKANPSAQPGSKNAGPPIHVDPYPHSAGMHAMPRISGSMSVKGHAATVTSKN